MIEPDFALGASLITVPKANMVGCCKRVAVNKRVHISANSLSSLSYRGGFVRRKRASGLSSNVPLPLVALGCRKRAIYALMLALLHVITWTATSQLVTRVGAQEATVAPQGTAVGPLEAGQSIPVESQRRSHHQHQNLVPARHAAQAATLRVTEADLIPISDFNVPQPAFNDLMRNWPPTTLRALAEAQRHRQSRLQQQQQHHHSSSHHLQHQQHHNRGQHPKRKGGEQFEDEEAEGGGGERSQLERNELRNFLDEDMDDGLVTADQKFEQDHVSELIGRVYYLRELGDYIYAQMRSPEIANDQAKLEHIEELLDDQYYHQYENSQVLYYGPQLAREGDMVEIGCYMPINQPATWTRSGRPIPEGGRLVRRNEFLHAKLNFSLKIFEASPTDSGNYRCNGMSRKYHKLVVVSHKTSVAQLYLIQQRILTVIKPAELSQRTRLPPLALAISTSRASRPAKNSAVAAARRQLVPGYLISENEPLIINCNISDESVARRLRENPSFLLDWYKNGKLLSLPQRSIKDRQLQPQQPGQSLQYVLKFIPGGQRIQLVQPNGRQLYISQARYSDYGDYLCSWSKLPPASQLSNDGASDGDDQTEPQATGPANPLAAGSLVQLLAPVKLRPFRSTYHVRTGNQLRLVCQVQRGYPSANISWYIANRLVDAEFLRNHSDEFQVLQLHDQNRFSASPTNRISLASLDEATRSSFKIVEINPIPMGRPQQLGHGDHGRWVDYRDATSDKYAIDTPEQQLKYLHQKLVQLTGANHWNQHTGAGSAGEQMSQNQLINQAAISVLVVNSVKEEHSSRYACRASTRANTDEVTTVIQVQESSVSVTRPSTAKATLVVGEPLYFECRDLENSGAQFLWLKEKDPAYEFQDNLINPSDLVEIHNERLVLLKPGYDAVGDYRCNVVDQYKRLIVNQSAVIRVRQELYIGDFGRATSHTGRSSIINRGERLELTCSTQTPAHLPVNITWLKSSKPDDDAHMYPIPESLPPLQLADSSGLPMGADSSSSSVPTYLAAEHSIVIERVGNNSKKLVINSIDYQHRGFYGCRVDNGVTEAATKRIFIRVKDNLVALWPALGIVAELVILATIIYIWETQRAYKQLRASTAGQPQTSSPQTTLTTKVNKREPAGATKSSESVPLTNK